MTSVPLKPEYRPTLAQLLAPRWQRASRARRLLVVVLVAGLVLLAVALVLALLPARITYGGPAPFSFSYMGLYRTAPDPGGDVKVQRRTSKGRLRDSFAVQPIMLPPYQGSLSGELPLYASGYIRALETKYRGFQLRGEGKARVSTGAVAYNVYYTAKVEGHTMYGRDFLLLPERPGAHAGVALVMLTSPHSNAQVTSPLLVATAGVLFRPLRTFSFS